MYNNYSLRKQGAQERASEGGGGFGRALRTWQHSVLLTCTSDPDQRCIALTQMTKPPAYFMLCCRGTSICVSSPATCHRCKGRSFKLRQAGYRTPIDCLEGNHANHYTTDASSPTGEIMDYPLHLDLYASPGNTRKNAANLLQHVLFKMR